MFLLYEGKGKNILKSTDYNDKNITRKHHIRLNSLDYGKSLNVQLNN